MISQLYLLICTTVIGLSVYYSLETEIAAVMTIMSIFGTLVVVWKRAISLSKDPRCQSARNNDFAEGLIRQNSKGWLVNKVELVGIEKIRFELKQFKRGIDLYTEGAK